MQPAVHPGRILTREMAAGNLSANRLSLDVGGPSGGVTDILNGRRAIRRAARPVLRQQRAVLARSMDEIGRQ